MNDVTNDVMNGEGHVHLHLGVSPSVQWYVADGTFDPHTRVEKEILIMYFC